MVQFDESLNHTFLLLFKGCEGRFHLEEGRICPPVPFFLLRPETMNHTGMQKTALVVLYNHNYEKNIPLIKKLYGHRFSRLFQLMPFYYGNDSDVIPVYGNSFYFQSYIAQAKHKLMALDCDYILFIGDDLLLNPEFDEYSSARLLSLQTQNDFYFDEFVDVSKPICYRGTSEAHNFNAHPHGLDESANRILCSYDEAFSILHGKGLLETVDLKRVKPYYPNWKKPFLSHLKKNYKILRARAWHFRNMLKYKLGNKKAAYPVVFGYSDIVAVPKTRLLEWCSYLEIFATWNMFVELAIPTSLLLMPDANIITNDKIPFKTGNVWFPQNPDHYAEINRTIETLVEKSASRIDFLTDSFPKEYLYLHPLKLSKFS